MTEICINIDEKQMIAYGYGNTKTKDINVNNYEIDDLLYDLSLDIDANLSSDDTISTVNTPTSRGRHESLDSSDENNSLSDFNLSHDTLLSDNEIKFIADIFNDEPVDYTNKHAQKKQRLDIQNPYRRSDDSVYKALATRNHMTFEKNFFEFTSRVMANDYNSAKEMLNAVFHPKCLVRFKITEIHAQAGPKSFMDFITLKSRAFPDAVKCLVKKKSFISHGYYIYKSKFKACGNESNFDSIYEFFSLVSNSTELKAVYERKDNFQPQKVLFKCISTLYLDPFTFQIVLCDMGLEILNCGPAGKIPIAINNSDNSCGILSSYS